MSKKEQVDALSTGSRGCGTGRQLCQWRIPRLRMSPRLRISRRTPSQATCSRATLSARRGSEAPRLRHTLWWRQFVRSRRNPRLRHGLWWTVPAVAAVPAAAESAIAAELPDAAEPAMQPLSESVHCTRCLASQVHTFNSNV